MENSYLTNSIGVPQKMAYTNSADGESTARILVQERSWASIMMNKRLSFTRYMRITKMYSKGSQKSSNALTRKIVFFLGTGIQIKLPSSIFSFKSVEMKPVQRRIAKVRKRY